MNGPEERFPAPPQPGASPRRRPRERPLSQPERTTIIYGMLCVVLLLVVLQLWLLTATMNAFLGGDDSIVWPAAAASLVCFGLNLGLFRYLYRLEQ